MCGVAGTVGAALTQPQFDALFAAIAHRGPDASGTFTIDGIRLGMHRLHLRGDAAEIPVRHAEGIVAFNGQVYGAGGLEDEAVAIARTAMSGSAAAPDGMYAGAVLRPDRTIGLTTDPQFIKPMFYRQLHGGIAFCSELGPLLHILPHGNRVDRDAIADLICYGWYLGDRAWIDGVRLVTRGNVDLVDDAAVAAVPPATDLLRAPDRRREPSEEELRAAISDSVRMCVGGRGPFGLALSGGLDSTVLAWELEIGRAHV